ncbi:hypothetical protein [Paenibacillus sp. CCS19]|uniref:hypothetical protein n=1 Tax=Paenibacillus sp. CCS19 TaxID=3158387 RepID=UPI00295EF0D2|nr:hypothetical protein [Paenibacillus cellulosilyticus]
MNIGEWDRMGGMEIEMDNLRNEINDFIKRKNNTVKILKEINHHMIKIQEYQGIWLSRSMP